ncbi:MAG: sel1 repeat family protein [Lautropia sp.]|nr:sel1 repeat family protein [Lautropia sp.]
MTSRTVSLLGLVTLLGACAMQQQAVDTQAGRPVRICTEEGGCRDKARAQGHMAPQDGATTQEEARIAMLEKKAEQDPRAAFDLALRFFRGDGVRRDSYKALKWMRDAAERGNTKAQVALGRFYLSGFEEMGADPAEAESWLQTAAGQGDAEAGKLLETARLAKQDESEYRRWVDLNRTAWLGYWWNAYRYYTYWHAGYWYYY